MVHPREGWQGDGTRRPLVSRRGFLKGAGAGLAALGAGSLLEACAPALAGHGSLPLPRRDNPVTWPIFNENLPIKSNLQPETGATLQIYNWVAYINQAVVNNFAKKYNCKVQVTTFNTMNEALSKLRSGGVSFDILIGLTVNELGQVIKSKLAQPLNHSYLPHIRQAWPDFTNPFYDQRWQYTIPYTIYTTGISWRKDYVHENPYAMRNPSAMPWQSKYRGNVAILDDYREGISLGLMKNGLFDLNTTDQRQIALSRRSLQQLSSLVNVRIDNNDYTEVPTGDTSIHHAWSGDMAAAASYMPKGVPVDVVGYSFPPRQRPGGQRHDRGAPLRAQPGTRPPVPELHARPAQCAGEHQLQRVHAAADRGDAAAPGEGENPADEPAVHRGTAVVLPARAGRAAAAGGRGRALAAGLARGRQRNLRTGGGVMARCGAGRQGSRADGRKARPRKNLFYMGLALPGIIWLIVLFIVPFYAVLAIAMGQLDRLFESPIAVWNPLSWSSSNVINAFHDLVGSTSFASRIVARTIIYVAVGSLLCLLIGYPAAYFVARFAGRRKGLFLILLIAPFWISYIMRMLAWIDLLQTNGYLTRALVNLHLVSHPVNWLGGLSVTVVLGLVSATCRT